MKKLLMKRLLFVVTALLMLVSPMWAANDKPKLENPKEGLARYVVVLWEPGTPVPGNGKGHMPKMAEPDYGKLGGTVMLSEGNTRVVDMPAKSASKLRKDRAVASLQRLWMGEPEDELVEPPDDDDQNVRTIQTETDVDVTWGPRAYTYDGSGNITEIGTDSYVYDTAGRLIRATVSGKTESFKYDEFGNLVEKAIAGANPEKIPVDGATNRMIGAEYDAFGNVLTRKGAAAYTYDAMNMLASRPGGGGRMVYDADDERIGVIIDSVISRWWVRGFDGEVLREYKGGVPMHSTWYWEQDWVYAEGQLVGGERETFQFLAGDTTYYYGGKRHYHLDHLGSVRVVTDSIGRSVSEHDYYAFGVTPTKAYQEQINWGDPQIDAMRYAGHQREFLGLINAENTDYLDYMHARYYDPNLGRFLSVDPVGDWDPRQPQAWNMYSYVRNNPLNLTDPQGTVASKPPPLPVVSATVWVTGDVVVYSSMGWFFNEYARHQLDKLKMQVQYYRNGLSHIDAREIIIPYKSETPCKGYWARVGNNFKKTNTSIAGPLAPTGMTLFTTKTIANAAGLPSMLQVALARGGAVTVAGNTFGVGEGVVAARAASSLSFAATGLSYEGGVLIGSLINGALTDGCN